MLEEFMNVMTENELVTAEEELKNAQVKNLIDGLEMFSNDVKMLTNAYTDILCDDNVVYLLTRISQHPIFMRHFPELYQKNENGESVINCQQNSPYHRYGVFRHILYTIEYVAKDNLNYSKEEIKLLKWTMFLHDIGKPMAKTTNLEGKDSFSGHDDISVEIATGILDRFYFSEEEKKIILTLIKYHDRYLNEGELTYDNLSFLAQELENKKELFNMIIEVKTADNKAKSIAVYNKFTAVIPKYTEFAQNYFVDIEPSIKDNELDNIFVEEIEKNRDEDEELIVGTKKVETTINKTTNNELQKEQFEQVYQEILYGRGQIYNYIPVVDARNKKIMGFEIKSLLEENIDMDKFMEFAKEEGKFVKINQLVALNQMEKGILSKKNNKSMLIIRMDLLSFVKYNNKARIYDITDKNNVLILFENYDYSNVTDINKICKEIKRMHGMTGLANFQNSTFGLKELSNLDVDYVESIFSKDKTEELSAFCSENAKKLWVSNLKTKKQAQQVIKQNCSILSGAAVLKITDLPDTTDYEVEQFVDGL